jgi:hypothetical protein
MQDSTPVCRPFPGKPVVAAFDGGRLSSDSRVLLLGEIDRRLGISERLAGCLRDDRAPERVMHSYAEMIRLRAWVIRMVTTATRCVPVRPSRWPSAGCRRRGPVFACDRLAAGEQAGAGFSAAHEGGDDRPVLRQLRPGAASGGAGAFRQRAAVHRRHGGQGPRRAATVAVPCQARQPLRPSRSHGPPIALRSRPKDTGARLCRGCEANGVGYILGPGINPVPKATVRDLTEDAALAGI